MADTVVSNPLGDGLVEPAPFVDSKYEVDADDPSDEEEEAAGPVGDDPLMPKSFGGAVPTFKATESKGIRGLVSQKKRRFEEDGFDLDLTYITPQIIAMGYPTPPGEFEARYRNQLADVQGLLNKRHDGKYKVYNLCSEREYDTDLFSDAIRFPFDDHNAPPLGTIAALCDNASEFLAQGDDYVVAIHCKAGKGRTGLMVAALMLKLGEFDTAADALTFFGWARTQNAKGVAIPSQKRYVDYYARILNDQPPARPKAWLHGIKVYGCPNFDLSGGCDPYIKVRQWDQSSTMGFTEVQPQTITCSLDTVDIFKAQGCDYFCINLPTGIEITGDARIELYDQDHANSDDKMCAAWFNVGYTENSFILTKNEVDGAVKDTRNRHFDNDFKLEIFLGDSAPVGGMSDKLGPSGATGNGAEACCLVM